MVPLVGKHLNNFFMGVKHELWICSVWVAYYSFVLPKENIHLAIILKGMPTLFTIAWTSSWWIIYQKLNIYFVNCYSLTQRWGKQTFFHNFHSYIAVIPSAYFFWFAKYMLLVYHQAECGRSIVSPSFLEFWDMTFIFTRCKRSCWIRRQRKWIGAAKIIRK